MLKGIIHICPECRKVILEGPNIQDNTINVSQLLCVSDDYRMKQILLDSLMVDRLLKDEVNKCQ